MIGHGIGIPFEQNRNAPFSGDLAFDFNTRTDLVLNNRIGDNGSFIGGYVADFDSIDTTELNAGQDSDFNIGTDDFWMAGTFMTKDNSASQGIQGCNKATANVDRYGIQIYSGEVLALFGTTTGASIITSIPVLSNVFYNYIVTFNRSGNVTIYVGSSNNSIDISTYSSHNLLQDNDYRLGNYGSVGNAATSALNGYLGVQIFGKGALPTSADIEAARYGDFSTVIPKATRVWYLNNNEESTAKRSLSNTDVDFTLINDTQLQSVKDALNEGYYIDGSGNKIINPQYAATTEEVVLGGKLYNGIECFALLPNTPLFDRSNATTHNSNSTDSVYYDASYPTLFYMGKFDFDISPTETITAYGELDYNVIQTYLTSSYMQKIFTKISQNYGDGNEDYIDRILAYTTQKTGDDLLRVLRYINYFDYTLNYVQDEDNNYVLDIYNRPLTE